VRERRETRQGLSLAMLAILFLTCIAIQGVSIVKASPAEPRVFVDPTVSTVAPVQNFNVTIKVSDINASRSLYSWEFKINFNTTVLDAVTVREGPFLKTVGDLYYGTYFRSKINNTLGYVSALDMLLNNPDPPYELPPQGAVGNGTLCTITFQAQANGKTLLHFEYTELYTVTAEELDPIGHTPKDGFFEYPLRVHDIAVTSVVPRFKGTVVSAAYRTWNLSVSVTIRNQGSATEATSVTAYYYYLIWRKIGTQNVTSLASGAETTLTFNWKIASLTANATYTLKANATLIVDGVSTLIPDSNLANNEFVYGLVKVRLWGDVDGNGAINILDLKKVKLALSLLIVEPFADLDGDCDADILDLKKDKLLLSGLLDPFGP